MLHGPGLHGDANFAATRLVVANQINAANDLDGLASQYHSYFFKPLLSKGSGSPLGSSDGDSDSLSNSPDSPGTSRRKRSSYGGTSSSPLSGSPRNSTSKKVSLAGSSSPKHKKKIHRKDAVRKAVRERDGGKCVLTGYIDVVGVSDKPRGYQVAHIVPHSLINQTHDVRQFIQALFPWLPANFFTTIDTCENAILLSSTAHSLFGNFDWFIEMDENKDTNLSVYRAMQVENNGLLKDHTTGRWVAFPFGFGGHYKSSYNQPLFIGTLHSRPAKLFVKMHELIARIVHMRGGAEALVGYLEDEDEDEVDFLMDSTEMTVDEKVRRFLDQTSSTTLNGIF